MRTPIGPSPASLRLPGLAIRTSEYPAEDSYVEPRLGEDHGVVMGGSGDNDTESDASWTAAC
ncbi:MAG: hypothetical protein ACI915_001437 [Gammaproteobacteria bacterium]|jgi:hypothetical protein